ncbi:MAG: hypothetical protein ACRDGQ_10775, partial [Candidatus Limnocylindrales bacterium]
LIVGLAGLAMLAYPGYASALLTGDHIFDGFMAWSLPMPVAVALVAAGAALSVAGLWRPRLLGPASVLISGYWWAYVFAPLGLAALPDDA